MKAIVTGGSGFIGSFLCERLVELGFNVVNYDVKSPIMPNRALYLPGNIMDVDTLFNYFCDFKPDLVFHLAAKADVFGKSYLDYEVNITGTKNVLLASRQCNSVKKVIFTSTQLVNKPGIIDLTGRVHSPMDELYSRSKANAELLFLDEEYNFDWTILRPTNIWGPYHPRFPQQMWKYISRGCYFHPNQKITRSYGYVENVVEQIVNASVLANDRASKKIFYVGDQPIDSALWVDSFSIALRGKKAKRFPIGILKVLATCGEFLKRIGFASPIYMDRYKSMTSDYIVPMEETFKVLGKGSYELLDGVTKTVNFLRNGISNE